MYLTDILNDIHRIQCQVGNSRAMGLNGFFGDFPAVQVYTSADQMVVRAELPGLNRDEIQLSITDDVLSISGEIKKVPVDNNVSEKTAWNNGKFRVYRRERKSGKFQKTIELPYPVDGSQSAAVLKNGILTVALPLEVVKKYGKQTIY
jgi:HSP20 family protein